MVGKVSAVRKESEMLGEMLEEGKRQLRHLDQELKPLAKQVFVLLMVIMAMGILLVMVIPHCV